MRAVLFDLGNTLVSYYAAADFEPILRRAVRGCIEALEPGMPVDEDEIFQRALTLNVERMDHAVWPLVERLNVLFHQFAAASPQSPGGLQQENLDAEAKERLIAAFLEPIFATAVIDPNALVTLGALRAAGFRTAIVSNTPWGSPAQLWRAELARHNLLAAVDAAVFCVDVGYRKPHRAPFDRALSLLGARAEGAFFVGDDPRWDVAGAQLAGIRPVLLAPARPAAVPDTVPIARNLQEVFDHVTRQK
jgi:FMN phosphatase YigB (HAD superfamily)